MNVKRIVISSDADSVERCAEVRLDRRAWRVGGSLLMRAGVSPCRGFRAPERRSLLGQRRGMHADREERIVLFHIKIVS